MSFLLSVIVGVLFSVGLYLLMQKSLMKLVLGVLVLSNGANLLIFVAGGIKRGLNGAVAPVIAATEKQLSMASADPLPQALILTAIVIGFGVIAYFIVLVKTLYTRLSQQDLSAMIEEEGDS